MMKPPNSFSLFSSIPGIVLHAAVATNPLVNPKRKTLRMIRVREFQKGVVSADKAIIKVVEMKITRAIVDGTKNDLEYTCLILARERPVKSPIHSAIFKMRMLHAGKFGTITLLF